MANINLIRIDSRLIHGQVITKWVKVANAGKIIIVDDPLSKDSFMADIYIMAAPKDVKVEIMSVEQAMARWSKDNFGDGNILILFKDVETCYRLFKLGFPMKYLQIGGLPSAAGRTTVLRAVSFDSKDAGQLKEMSGKGTEVVLHIIPEESKMEFDKVLKKFKNL
ncbi:PTS sugar transporter subunit IIB [Petroclostridium sp. X23]|uniref:PTS system mannose/fructose/N-acetylgalactosamine-transporter subunit IIB n=1 Tax=Petroclostridium sp. X23 TaxID=3045146 RepID=UPI0024AE2D9B|nr:PTS sugar transporter subunit IIB [Petroclostridium sp. X23]WHH60520.1 PTS sugar transporter subunit IIB [Petroclostridium sp. X23]